MHFDSVFLGFQVNERYIFGFDVSSPDFDAGAVDQVVAMCFDEERLVANICQLGQQGCKFRLCLWVQMYLWLLQQEVLSSILTQTVDSESEEVKT